MRGPNLLVREVSDESHNRPLPCKATKGRPVPRDRCTVEGTLRETDVGRRLQLQNFKFRWHTSTGLAFQDLFADVMENAWPNDFRRVSPYGGSSGDLKCDGFLKSKKCVFQCYGPVSIRERDVMRKIKVDLVSRLRNTCR